MLGRLSTRALVAMFILSCASVDAATFTIDWSGINGTSYSIGTGITLSLVGGNMTFNNPGGAESPRVYRRLYFLKG